MKSTIKDVAKLAGVSIATVSRMLNNTGFVLPETQEKIRDAIEKLEYTPNSRARSFKTGKNHMVAVVVPDISNPFFASVINEIEHYVGNLGYKLLIANTNEDEKKEKEILQFLSQGSVDGIILASTISNYAILSQYLPNPSEIPVVLIDRKVDGWPYDAVLESDADTIFHIVQQMCKNGHSKIGCISGLEHLSTTQERVAAYQSALLSQNISLTPSYVCTADSLNCSGYDYTSQLLDSGCTAILVIYNALTRDVIRCILDRGLTPGKEIAIAGYYNPDFLNINMHSIQLPLCDLGKLAAERIISRIENQTLAYSTIELPAPQCM